MGRPLKADLPRDKRVEITIDEVTLKTLDAEKKRTGKSRAQIIIELIDTLDNT